MTFREELIQVAAVAVAIVQDLDNGSTVLSSTNESLVGHVLLDVKDERQNQENKWGPQHHTPEEWLAILAEEVGEAAGEVYDPAERRYPLDPSDWTNEHMDNVRVDVLLWDLKMAERSARHFLRRRFGIE